MIIQNAIEFNGTIYVSHSAHQVVDLPFKDGSRSYQLLGGLEFQKHNINCQYCNEPSWDDNGNIFTWLYLDNESTIEDIKTQLVWGPPGHNGELPSHYQYIKDLDSNYIQEILDSIEENIFSLGEDFLHLYIMQLILKDRKSSKQP